MKIFYSYFILFLILSLPLLGDQKAYDIVDQALKTNNPTRKITYQMIIKDEDSEKERLFFLKNKKIKEIDINNTFIRFFSQLLCEEQAF